MLWGFFPFIIKKKQKTNNSTILHPGGLASQQLFVVTLKSYLMLLLAAELSK